MKQLRVEQMKNEPPDMFLIRAFSQSLPRMDEDTREAFWHYLWKRSGAELLRSQSAANCSHNSKGENDVR